MKKNNLVLDKSKFSSLVKTFCGADFFLMQDIIYQIKFNTLNNIESIKFYTPIWINTPINKLITTVTDNEIRIALEKIYTLFPLVIEPAHNENEIIRLMDRLSFSKETIYFQTYPLYIELLEVANYDLNIFIDTFNFIIEEETIYNYKEPIRR